MYIYFAQVMQLPCFWYWTTLQTIYIHFNDHPESVIWFSTASKMRAPMDYLTARPGKIMLGSRNTPFGVSAYFQGRAVSFLGRMAISYCWWNKSCYQLRLVVYPSIYRVLYLPGWLFGISCLTSYHGESERGRLKPFFFSRAFPDLFRSFLRRVG